ncbi:hypothetical protein M2108_000296 [Paenibacillus sp. PastM-3]|uniref:hypothetical protein n=1 Tax=Paenibacillus sp. PastM-3 TaxID=2940534 RepID=UPI00247729C2|nr:hypothetical protein [Paenibacillus sp. PastM-3]MDH6505344.1 hypothetical protein [Paenibacillus sp. PastM-3]
MNDLLYSTWQPARNRLPFVDPGRRKFWRSDCALFRQWDHVLVLQGTMFLSSDTVGGLEHSPIRARAQRGFSVLWDQVLVLCSGQELDPIAENGQEHGTIADLMNV